MRRAYLLACICQFAGRITADNAGVVPTDYADCVGTGPALSTSRTHMMQHNHHRLGPPCGVLALNAVDFLARGSVDDEDFFAIPWAIVSFYSKELSRWCPTKLTPHSSQ